MAIANWDCLLHSRAQLPRKSLGLGVGAQTPPKPTILLLKLNQLNCPCKVSLPISSLYPFIPPSTRLPPPPLCAQTPQNLSFREVASGLSACGVRVKNPHFSSTMQFFAHLSGKRKEKGNGRKTTKRRKNEQERKMGQFTPTPSTTNPIKNFPKYHWGQNDYLPNFYSRRIILGNSMSLMCTKEKF